MQDRTPNPPNNGNPVPDFTPVPRKYRHDGWTPERQRAFIDALAEVASVTRAAKRINMSPEGAYYLRRQPGAEEFRTAWAAALDFGVQRLTDIAIDRATEGVPVPVYWRGEQVGEKRWYNDRLLMFILKHHQPRKYNPPTLPTGTRHPDTLRREWEAERAAGLAAQAAEATKSMTRKLKAIRTGFKRSIAHDPAKRAAWDLLVGPTDWEDLTAIPNGHGSSINMNRSDMIVPLAADANRHGSPSRASKPASATTDS